MVVCGKGFLGALAAATFQSAEGRRGMKHVCFSSNIIKLGEGLHVNVRQRRSLLCTPIITLIRRPKLRDKGIP